jgi:hypothetical protein
VQKYSVFELKNRVKQGTKKQQLVLAMKAYVKRFLITEKSLKL